MSLCPDAATLPGSNNFVPKVRSWAKGVPLSPEAVTRELVDSRSLSSDAAETLVGDLTSDDAAERMRNILKDSEDGRSGMVEIDQFLELANPTAGDARISFTPRLVRGLDHYTGVIFEVIAEGMPGSIASGGRYNHLISAMGGPDLPACGGSLGVERIIDLIDSDATKTHRLDVAITVMNEDSASDVALFATNLRNAHLRTEVYLLPRDKSKTGQAIEVGSRQASTLHPHLR
jgi:histidyl-tRNA synthetase